MLAPVVVCTPPVFCVYTALDLHLRPLLLLLAAHPRGVGAARSTQGDRVPIYASVSEAVQRLPSTRTDRPAYLVHLAVIDFVHDVKALAGNLQLGRY